MGIRENTLDTLLELGGKPNHIGFYYIIEAMSCIQKDENVMFHITHLYNEIAKKRNSTAGCVERNIRYCIQKMPDDAWLKVCKSHHEKKTVSLFISALYLYIKRGEK